MSMISGPAGPAPSEGPLSSVRRAMAEMPAGGGGEALCDLRALRGPARFLAPVASDVETGSAEAFIWPASLPWLDVPVRIVFYARPWTVDLHLALTRRWQAQGAEHEFRWVTHHLEAAEAVRRAGHDVVFMPEAAAHADVREPRATLEALERRHGQALQPLPRYLMADRYFAGRPMAWQLDQMARTVTVLEQLLDDFRPELLVGEAPDLMPEWLAYDIATQVGTRVVGCMASTIPAGRLLMLDGHERIPGASERFAEIRARELRQEELAAADALQDTVLGSGTSLDYLPTRRMLDVLRRMASGQFFREHGGGILAQRRELRAGNWFVQPGAHKFAMQRAVAAVRGRVADRRYLLDERPTRPFVFYPLHYEPEATTLVHGSFFENQVETIRNLARSMPIGWDLVVKEHFYMRGLRRLGVYHQLRRIPNVRLVPFSVPTNSLIQDAQVVAVIASTVGLEASLIGKPVVMFGDYPWDYAPTVHKVGRLQELPALLRRAAEVPLGPAHPDVRAFAASWDAALPVGKHYRTRAYDWLEEDNVRAIAHALEAAGRERVPVSA